MANLGASDLAGIGVRQARQRHNWTAKDLADRCAAAGAPQITPTVITNLETRRRKTREITLDEVLVLAHVLEVPPLQLVVPQNASEELEVVPGVNLDALAAADWIAGVRIDDLSSPELDADGPFARWQERVARMVGREVFRHRHRRKLSASQLADRTAELGMPVSRSVLADLEAGKRDAVAVAEVLVLAASLGVAPTELICPVGFDEQIELLPGQMMEPLQASRWVDGELALDASSPETAFRVPEVGEESGPRLAENHAALLEQVDVQEAEAARVAIEASVARTGADMAEAAASDALEHDKDAAAAAALKAEADRLRRLAADRSHESAYRTTAAAQYREVAAQSLRLIRAEMRNRGMLLPDLPPLLKDKVDGRDGSGR
jgi:transcriptional regulator with XRE-family HTH domain